MARFQYRLRVANKERGLLMQGLDPVLDKIPAHIKTVWSFNLTQMLLAFLIPIIDATAPHVAGFKPNISFFLAFDDEKSCKFYGQEAQSIICQYIRQKYPNHILVLDAKDGDIGASNDGYAKRAFVGYEADAVTWDPYLGVAMKGQALKYKGKGFIALGRTSNSEGTALQNLQLKDGRRVFEATVDEWLKARKEGCQIGFVAGATHPEELGAIRKRVGAALLLVPGVGAQQGDLMAVVNAGFCGTYGNMLINVSSGSLYASRGTDFAEAAAGYMQNLNDTIATILSRG